ncbi:MAG: UDP-N-acetylmuramate dehydrogenase [Myxococcota bacterium]
MIAPAARAALREALGDAVRFGVPLRRFTSLRVGGPADAVVTPADRGELSRALVACAAHAIPHCVLGGGFNTIAREGGVDGVVLVMRKLRGLALRDDGTIRAEAGVSHNTLTKLCIANGRSGLEFGAGIPGTIGGWVAMNAGIGEREVKDAIVALEVMRPDGTLVETIERDRLDFRYRGLHGLAKGAVVVAAIFATTASTPEAVRAEVDRLLARRHATQPLDAPSCGSVFKNPPGDFAGRLVEEVGLKGATAGGAQISTVHANFIVNRGDASADDVLALVERARRSVREAFGVELETEVEILGRADAPRGARGASGAGAHDERGAGGTR